MTHLLESYGSIAQVGPICISALDSIRGIPMMAGSPAELTAAIRGIKLGREALRQAGCCGLPTMNLISTAAAALTTMPAQKEVINVLGEMYIRNQFFVMVGGGPVTRESAAQAGADGYGQSAIQAVETAKRLMNQKG